MIIFAGEKSGYGNIVEIQHDDGTQTRYAHLQDEGIFKDFKKKYEDWNIEQDPKKKEELRKKLEVTEGQEIGKVGDTGARSAGPHLHFEILKNNGGLDDPQKYLGFELRSDTTGCGYPQVKSMDVIAQTRVRKAYKVFVECQTTGLVVYGKLEGDRVTKLYLDEYARMGTSRMFLSRHKGDERVNLGVVSYVNLYHNCPTDLHAGGSTGGIINNEKVQGVYKESKDEAV